MVPALFYGHKLTHSRGSDERFDQFPAHGPLSPGVDPVPNRASVEVGLIRLWPRVAGAAASG